MSPWDGVGNKLRIGSKIISVFGSWIWAALPGAKRGEWQVTPAICNDAARPIPTSQLGKLLKTMSLVELVHAPLTAGGAGAGDLVLQALRIATAHQGFKG